MKVNPQGAEVDAPVLVDRYVKPGENMAEGAWKTLVQVGSFLGGHKQKMIIRAIALNSSLYMLGNVVKDADGTIMIAQGKDRFFISTKSEEQLLKSLDKLGRLDDFEIDYQIAPFRNLVPQPQIVSLYVTAFVIEKLINHKDVVDIYGSDEEIYLTINQQVKKYMPL